MKTQGRRWLKRKLEEIRSLESYSIDRTIESVAKQFGIVAAEVVKLNYNENFFIQQEKFREILKEIAEECDPRVYPQEEEYKLKEKLGGYLNVPKDFIVVGNGSDELVERVARLFLKKKDSVLSIKPTFPIYKYCTSHLGTKCGEVSLKKDFGLNIKEILTMTTPKTRILYLCSPNNPTANQFGISEIQTLAEKFPGIVIVDEAYVEYAEYSVVPLLEEFENLIVLRTFSKAFGLAGLRLGYVATDPNLAKVLSEKTPQPYSVSSITLRMGLKLLEKISMIKEAVGQLKVEREKLIEELNETKGVKAFSSQTNFVLFQTKRKSEKVYQDLLRRGIIIKNLGKILHLNNCLRTTVGLAHMNARLLKTLEETLSGKND